MPVEVRVTTAVVLRMALIALAGTGVAGCGIGKAYTKPHSKIVEEAAAAGIEMPTVEEERRLFFEGERIQERRLLALVKTRAGIAFRDPNYRLGAGDEVEINVFDVPELNVSARVRESGYLSLPLVGAVRAAGLTEQELLEALRERLTTYVRQPEVTVFVSEYGSQKVAVMGAVRTPGTYALRKGTNSVLELISQAGGVSERAGNHLNFIPGELSGVASGSDVEARARLALASHDQRGARNSGIEIYLDQVMGTSGGIPLEIPVRGGDMIVIPEAGKVMVEGEVAKGGTLDLGRQMTLLGALAAAGGITYGAKVDEVEIVREAGLGDRKARLLVDLELLARGEDRDVRLKNGDIVRVPSDSGRRLKQDTWEGITSIINFGVGGSVSVVP